MAANSAKRSSFAPDLPAIAETIPGYDFATVVGIFGRADLTNEVVRRLSTVAAATAKNADLGKALSVVGVDVVGSDSEAFREALVAETTRLREVLARAGLATK